MGYVGGENAAAGECSVRMWGYLPAASPQRTPLLQPTPVPVSVLNDPLKTVCNGGCGFGIAISESGNLNTWGSTTDLGHCYLISGKQQEVPELYPLPTDSPIVHAAGGWAHCAAVTGDGEVYTWGWSECVSSLKLNIADDSAEPQRNDLSPDVPITTSQSPLRLTGGLLGGTKPTGKQTLRNLACKTTGSDGAEEVIKRRKVITNSAEGQSPEASEENAFAPPCLVKLDPGIRISSVAAGGRHTLALSDVGQVWGWGYGGEGQLGLGSCIRIVSFPQHIPCFNMTDTGNARSGVPIPGSYIKAIACGGRHSAVITGSDHMYAVYLSTQIILTVQNLVNLDTGAVLTFGWGLYGQLFETYPTKRIGQGSTEDELSPSHVSTLQGLSIVGIAAGLWHTLCITNTGDVYSFGGNQFGQLGVGGNNAELSPRLIDAPLLGDELSVAVACGARHSVVLTGSGKIFAWGWNKYGQLGLGDCNNRDLPMQVTMNDGGRAASIACGWWHTLASVRTK